MKNINKITREKSNTTMIKITKNVICDDKVNDSMAIHISKQVFGDTEK